MKHPHPLNFKDIICFMSIERFDNKVNVANLSVYKLIICLVIICNISHVLGTLGAYEDFSRYPDIFKIVILFPLQNQILLSVLFNNPPPRSIQILDTRFYITFKDTSTSLLQPRRIPITIPCYFQFLLVIFFQ